MLKKLKLFCLLFLFLLPTSAFASTLYMSPSESQFGPGDSFAVDIKLDVTGQCVNAVEAGITFPKDNVKLVDFIIGDSILNFWIEKPDSTKIGKANSEGKLSFSGGIPGGYCGRIPGDPGESNIIARLAFKIPGMIVSDKKPEKLNIDFTDITQVLLNDGFGTKDNLDLKGSVINLLNAPATLKDDWQAQVEEDNIPPEPFIIELQSNPNIYNGQYYIDFYTIDRQSGIDHYEVLELRPGEKIGDKPKREISDYLFGYKNEALNWRPGEIPYLLFDQDLKSVISVKAIDKAGNERIVDYIPPSTPVPGIEPASKDKLYMVSFIVAGFLLTLIIIWLIIKIIKSKKSAVNPIINNNQTDEEEKKQ